MAQGLDVRSDEIISDLYYTKVSIARKYSRSDLISVIQVAMIS